MHTTPSKSVTIPRTLTAFSTQILPQIHRAVRSASVIGDVNKIIATERWNSFDRFHDTTDVLLKAYKRNLSPVEIYRIQTGGEIGNGRWLIHEAADVVAARVDIVAPVMQRILDYSENPWHVIQWSAATPREGVRCGLITVDDEHVLQQMPACALYGKIVLTRLNAWEFRPLFFEKGAIGIISDAAPTYRSNLVERGTKADPACAWTKFGWGGLALGSSHARLVGFAISPAQGENLRALLQRYQKLTIHAMADIRHYSGTHDVVSAIVPGRSDPQSEVWALAHSSEPGALDNASGVAVCIEIAGVLNRMIATGRIQPPRRSIRLLNGYECYGFFHYLEHVKRFQTPLAGVCIDTVGARPDICERNLRWHGTVPSSANFVDDVGATFVKASLALDNAGYAFQSKPFVSTEDTLVGDPKYGFPCPLITNHPAKGYHSSADTAALLHGPGLQTITVAMAAYLYYLADAGTEEAFEIAEWQTAKTVSMLNSTDSNGNASRDERNALIVAQHSENLTRLKRWFWSGSHASLVNNFKALERTATEAWRPLWLPPGLIPRRRAPLAPTTENLMPAMASRLECGIPKWSLYWANGERTIPQICRLMNAELGRKYDEGQVWQYFEALAELGYAEIMNPAESISLNALICDLSALGVRPGMDLMVHSSMSKMGAVTGGMETVIDALLSVIGTEGTLLMPSFNHFNAAVFNPLTTPTTNGTLPDAFWRRAETVRSAHPSHSVAASGRKAAEYVRGHLENGIWGEQSPIGRLISNGGYLLLLGVTNESSTAYHIAEIAMKVGCLDQFASEDQMVFEDGSVRQVRGLAWRGSVCPISPGLIDRTLDERNLQKHGKVGGANATLVQAIDVYNVRKEHLKGECLTCLILPERRFAPAPYKSGPGATV